MPIFCSRDAQAQATASAIDAGTTTLDATITTYINNNVETTSPAIAILAFVDGVTPTSAKITELATTFEVNQLNYYTNTLKSANANLGPYEATGRAVAQTDANFATKYGTTAFAADADFVSSTYIKIFGQAASSGALANLNSQVSFFEALYTANGLSVAQAQLEARGSVLGQMVGYSFIGTDAISQAAVLDEQTALFERQIANNNTTGYGQPLPAAVNPGTAGVTISLVTGNENISTTSANTDFRSTANNDTVVGTLNAATKQSIDLGGGTDILQVKLGMNVSTAAAGNLTLTNTEILKINGAGFTFDATGLNGQVAEIGSFKATGATEFDNISSTFSGKFAVNTDGNTATTFQFAATAASADVTLTSDSGLVNIGTVAGTGATAVSLHAATNTTNMLNLWDATSLKIDGAGNTSFTLLEDTKLATIDESGATGKTSLNFDPNAGIKVATVTESAQNDVFSSALSNKVLLNLTTGAGNDTIAVTAAPTNASFNADGSLKTALVVTDFTKGSDHVDLTALTAANYVVTTGVNQGNVSAAATLQAAVTVADGYTGVGKFTAFTYGADSYVLEHGAATDGLVKLTGLSTFTVGTAAAGTADIFTS